jgi:hypothetical protein
VWPSSYPRVSLQKSTRRLQFVGRDEADNETSDTTAGLGVVPAVRKRLSFHINCEIFPYAHFLPITLRQYTGVITVDAMSQGKRNIKQGIIHITINGTRVTVD